MERKRNKYLLFNWLFVSGSIVLALNDHYLKLTFPNWITGKLSDLAGLFILPMFLLFIFPKMIRVVALISGIFFVFWKLPVSESFINLYNQFAIIRIVRTVDYSDLITLAILPLSHLFIQKIEKFKIKKLDQLSISPLFLLIPVSFIFMATSAPISYYMKPGGDIHIGESYKIKMSKDSILSRLKAEGFVVNPDSSQKDAPRRVDNYMIENLISSNGRDTIKSIQFGLLASGDKTLFLLNNVHLSNNSKLSDWRQLKRYSKYYNKLLKTEIIRQIE